MVSTDPALRPAVVPGSGATATGRRTGRVGVWSQRTRLRVGSPSSLAARLTTIPWFRWSPRDRAGRLAARHDRLRDPAIATRARASLARWILELSAEIAELAELIAPLVEVLAPQTLRRVGFASKVVGAASGHRR